MVKPLVTVVIPLHNYRDYVVQAIRSIQSQSLNNFECMVVNDSSTDNSEQVALEAIKGDARFKLFNVQFGNLSATRNFGIAQGTGQYICMVDADDEIGNENYLEVLVSELEKDRTLGIAYSSITLMDGDGKLGAKAGWPPERFDAEGQYAHINQIPSMCVFRREMWKRAGGFIQHFVYAQDADFWTTAIDIGYGAIHAVQEGWFHYRIHNKSQSQAHRTGEIPEPDWLEWHPWAKTGDRPLAAGGRPPRGSWPVRFYNEPQVSIIIPVGIGHEEVVKDALHSVEGQTFKFWECIVVDNTPDSVLGGRIDGFEWAKVIQAPYPLGAGAARNIGAREAHAPFVVFLDADDMLKPDFLALTLKAYKKHGKYVYTDWLTHDKMTNWQVHETPEYSYEAVRVKPSLHPITCLIPRAWFNAVGGFDEQLPAFEDVDLFMKFFVRGYCGVRVAKPLMIYNLDSGKRRKLGEVFRPKFDAMLKNRYGKFMEEHNMCSCIDPPKGKMPAAPTPENAADYKETYGNMVFARLVGSRVAEAPVTFRGPATRVMYGRRAKGEEFWIWEADLLNGGDTFELVENFATEPIATVIPPAPQAFETLSDAQVEDIIETMNVPSEMFTKDEPPTVASKPVRMSKASKTSTKPHRVAKK